MPHCHLERKKIKGLRGEVGRSAFGSPVVCGTTTLFEGDAYNVKKYFLPNG